MHASAVALRGRGVLFLGESGAGKSTAAAEMCFLHGAKLLADDVALLEIRKDAIHVLPADRHHSLTRASCRALGLRFPSNRKRLDKAAVLGAAPLGLRARLALVVALRFDDRFAHVTLRRLSGSDVVQRLVHAIVRFDLFDPASRRHELAHLVAIHDAVPVIEIVRPLRNALAARVGPLVLDVLDRGSRG